MYAKIILDLENNEDKCLIFNTLNDFLKKNPNSTLLVGKIANILVCNDGDFKTLINVLKQNKNFDETCYLLKDLPTIPIINEKLLFEDLRISITCLES